MKYVVNKGKSYTDTKGRNTVYGPGDVFEGELDLTQKWKVGLVVPAGAPELPYDKKGVGHAAQTEKAKAEAEVIDPMDEGEETE